MTHSYYPIALDLKEKACLVVGGGALATEKVEGLLHASARVMVVSPTLTPALESMEAGGTITVYRRTYEPADLDGKYLAYGATVDRAENARVAIDARRAGILVNAVDDIPYCDFFAVAIVRRGDLQIAISTNGLSPAFARWTRELLDRLLPRHLGDVLTTLAGVRQELKSRGLTPSYQRWQVAIDDEVAVTERGDGRETAHERVRAAVLDNAQRDMVGAVAGGSR
ncbi:MAG: hypothetical protein PVSMB7_05910 [Chloroflexota bacterium]